MSLDKKIKGKIMALLVVVAIFFAFNTISSHLQFSRVEAKANELETENAQLSANLSTVSADCNELQTNYTNLEQSHTELQGDYAELQGNYQTLSTDYDNLESSYSTLYDTYVDLSESILGYQAIKDPLTQQKGVNMFNGHRETYYNLPMGKVCSIATDRGIEGNYWEREDGAKMFGQYVIVATNWSLHPYGSIVETSLGEGIVLDTGTFINTYPEDYDLAVTW